MRTKNKPSNTTLYPSFEGQAIGRAPIGFTKLPVDRKSSELLERLALEIFTSMANAGFSFRKCLASIYLTGLHDATYIIKDQNTPSREVDRIDVTLKDT